MKNSKLRLLRSAASRAQRPGMRSKSLEIKVRSITILALLLGGGVYAGEAAAACPDQLTALMNPPYICEVTRHQPGSNPGPHTVQRVAWQVKFSRPVTGVGWDDFYINETTDQVPNTNPPQYYGTGSSDLDLKKKSPSIYNFIFRWYCGKSGNDCQHNQDVSTGSCETMGSSSSCEATSWNNTSRNVRYVGTVCLGLQSNPTWMSTGMTPLSAGNNNVNLTNFCFDVR